MLLSVRQPTGSWRLFMMLPVSRPLGRCQFGWEVSALVADLPAASGVAGLEAPPKAL